MHSHLAQSLSWRAQSAMRCDALTCAEPRAPCHPHSRVSFRWPARAGTCSSPWMCSAWVGVRGRVCPGRRPAHLVRVGVPPGMGMHTDPHVVEDNQVNLRGLRVREGSRGADRVHGLVSAVPAIRLRRRPQWAVRGRARGGPCWSGWWRGSVSHFYARLLHLWPRRWRAVDVLVVLGALNRLLHLLRPAIARTCRPLGALCPAPADAERSLPCAQKWFTFGK